MNKKDIVLGVILNKKCKQKRSSRFTTYYFDKIVIRTSAKLAKKIDSIVAKKNYRLLPFLIDNYIDMFLIKS